MTKSRLEEVNSDFVSLIAGNKNKIVKLQQVVGGEAPMTANLDMGGYRILNIAQPRDPRKYESDLVTAKTLYDYMAIVDQNFMRRDTDGSLDGRLNMSNHRIGGLADPTDADDAVTKRYVASRFQALSDEVQDKKSKLDALQNFLGVVNNQVLIRKYEIIDVHYYFASSTSRYGEGMKFVDARFRKLPHVPDDTKTYEFIDIFTLKEYFIHLLEKPVDDTTEEINNLEHVPYILISSSILILFHSSYTQETRQYISLNTIQNRILIWRRVKSKKISNDQELIQSDPISCPQNQKGNN